MTEQALVDQDAPEAIRRKLGAKGQRTRQQLIDATVALLETHGLRDVSVVDVARAAQTSPATFYVYFKGVPEVVLAALESATQTSPELEAIIARDWLKPGAAADARMFVDHYTEIWNRNRTIFVVRNLAAEEGVPSRLVADALRAVTLAEMADPTAPPARRKGIAVQLASA